MTRGLQSPEGIFGFDPDPHGFTVQMHANAGGTEGADSRNLGKFFVNELCLAILLREKYCILPYPSQELCVLYLKFAMIGSFKFLRRASGCFWFFILRSFHQM